MCSKPAPESPMGVTYIKFWMRFVCPIDDEHRKDTLLLRKNEGIIFYNTPLLPCVSPACRRIPCSLSTCLWQETGRLWCQSAQVTSQHPTDELRVSLRTLLLRLPTALLLSAPATHLLLLAEHWQTRLCWAWQEALLPAETSSVAPHITDWISCCSTVSISLLLSFPRKTAASWVTEKKIKKQGEKKGKRRSEEGRRGKRRNQPSHVGSSSFSTPTIWDTLSCL